MRDSEFLISYLQFLSVSTPEWKTMAMQDGDLTEKSIEQYSRGFEKHTVWKLRKFPLAHFWQNFVKVTVLQKKLLKSKFDEIFFR